MPLHRPYIRSSIRTEVENRAQKNEKGQFLDANTGQAIEGQYDLGHKPGHEHWREVEKAEKEGLTQEQFNDRMNNPDYYQIEDPHENRSHVHEQPKDTPLENNTRFTDDTSSIALDKNAQNKNSLYTPKGESPQQKRATASPNDNSRIKNDQGGESERGVKPSREDNHSSNKENSSERGQKPSSTESKGQSKGVERGQKLAESENKSQGNNSTPRGERPQEPPQNTSNGTTQRGTPPGSTVGEDSKTPTYSPNTPGDKVSANSAKTVDEASKVASEQTVQNVAPKPSEMNM